MTNDSIERPPTTFFGMLRRAGPGMIVAGSIVGSGELIATTKTGAEAGFVLMWLILLGCVIKVFVQVELGRYTLQTGKTTLAALAEVPGPSIRGRGNWLVWYWFAMWLASIAQLGGIVGGVGQALAISMPLTEQGQTYNAIADARIAQRIDTDALTEEERQRMQQEIVPAGGVGELERERLAYIEKYGADETAPHRMAGPPDDKVWAGLIAVFTAGLLYVGRYGLIQSFSTALVGSFTALTVANLFLLQREPHWHVRWDEFLSGLTLGLPQTESPFSAVATALFTFGIIGVGAAELVVYPYWCLEKGYARFTGRNDGSQQWIDRTRGWLRVMRLDAWGSMVVYTFATLAFYLLGAAVLNRAGLDPEGIEMVRTLATMYMPVFGQWAGMLFLFGAFAVLYSTYFVANASHARTFSDALRVIGLIAPDEVTRGRWIRWLSGFFPLLCLVIYLFIPQPVVLVMLSGLFQGMMLPMLAGAAIFLRYKKCDPALRPTKLWDVFLWTSGGAMLITGTVTAVLAVNQWLQA